MKSISKDDIEKCPVLVLELVAGSGGVAAVSAAK